MILFHGGVLAKNKNVKTIIVFVTRSQEVAKYRAIAKGQSPPLGIDYERHVCSGS